MFAAPEDPPLLRAFIACAALGVLLLLAGLLTASRWPPVRARIGRRAGGVLSVVAPVAWEVLDPARSGLEGAARAIAVWPLIALGAALWAAWAWRDRGRAGP
jgi:hypothetical protein